MGGMGGGGGEILLQKNSLTPSLLQLSYYSDKCFKICQVSDAWGKKKKSSQCYKEGSFANAAEQESQVHILD